MPVNRNASARRPHPRSQRHNSLRNPRRASSTGRRIPPRQGNEALAAFAAVALIATVVLVGFFVFRPSKNEAKLDLLVAADVTGSVGTASRQKLFGILDETVDGVLPKGSDVKLWAYGMNSHLISDKTPRKSEDLWPDEDKCIAYHPAIDKGTKPATVLKDMEASIESASNNNENVGIILLTDGEDTDYENPNLKRELEDVVTRLKDDRNVRAVWFAGTSTEPFRSLLERRLRPILRDRLVLSSSGDAQDGLNRFRAQLMKK